MANDPFSSECGPKVPQLKPKRKAASPVFPFAWHFGANGQSRAQSLFPSLTDVTSFSIFSMPL
ncbi:hypothetical protein [Thermopetrobacter sp. TC1]|uniref:hypothetical protein n=1 Tax=Thermopetrobacter sp. TC1 TaxID=1495045 RepID=UPI0012E06EEB|nr:hypothetical protein [Thermopetrobacter sp. TC1]